MKFIDNLRRRYTIWKVKKNLLNSYKYNIEVDRIMETWITKRILEGQQGRRNELIQMQNQIAERELFIDFIKKI